CARARGGGSETLSIGAESLTVNIARAEPEFVRFAGAHLLIGHMPRSYELTPDSHLLLLTEQLWRGQFGAAPDVIGRVVKLENEDWTIVGVMPSTVTLPEFRGERADLFQLVTASTGVPTTVLVRLKPGVSRATALAELDAIMK